MLKTRLANKLIKIDADKASRKISDVEQISRDVLQEVRETVPGYRSVGFVGELDNARLALEAADITGEVSYAEITLEPAHDSVLAMTLREAIRMPFDTPAPATGRALLVMRNMFKIQLSKLSPYFTRNRICRWT